MHRLAGSIRDHLHSRPTQDKGTEAVVQNASAFPSPSDFFRYRKQRGVNLGSWFVLERWICDAPFRFAASPAQSDLDVARGTQAKEILEHHWDVWITEHDWTWIAERGLNAIRLPIGYYHLCGADASVLNNTDFANFGHVYEGAWQRITNAIATANRYGLGVLIDLHAAPGSQNGDAHSGTSGKAQFFSKANMTHTLHVLSVLVTHLNCFCRSFDPPLANVVGIELLNEPQHDPSLEHWYLDAIRAVRSQDPSIPVYIGDSWLTDQYAGLIESNIFKVPFFVLDHHLYRCFTPGDASTPATQHTSNLRDPWATTPQMFSRVSKKVHGAFVVGEWSGALNPGSLHGVQNETEAQRDFVAAQLDLFEHCAGSFFWTYKKQYPGDKGWSLVDSVAAGVFPARVGLANRDAVLREDPQRSARRDHARDAALAQHTEYWAQHRGRRKFEHWRFDEGFLQGWDDAWSFFSSIQTLHPSASVPELGFKEPWLQIREKQHAAAKGNSNLWEYEHGFRQGAQGARNDVVSLH